MSIRMKIAAIVAGATLGLVVAAHAVQASNSQTGMASWYGGKFHGRKTASGERFNQNAYTAAHRTYRFGTRVCVKNTRNGRGITLRINDRGPFAKRRVIDVSKAAANRLGMVQKGIAPVRVTIVGRGAKLGARC